MLKQVICTLVLIHWKSKSVLSYCPTGCYCNNTLLKVTCSSPSLSILPITLNPHITSLTFSDSQVQAVDDSLQFYEALLLLDLSNNQIRNIQDGAFTFQVGWVILITFHQHFNTKYSTSTDAWYMFLLISFTRFSALPSTSTTTTSPFYQLPP